MSRLFKDLINNGLAQFEHARSNSKIWPKGYKDQIALNEIFLEKQLIKFPCTYLLAPFILRNFKNFLEPIQSYEDVPFFGPNMTHFPKQEFFQKTC